MARLLIIGFCLWLMMAGCHHQQPVVLPQDTLCSDTYPTKEKPSPIPDTPTESRLRAQGLVDIQEIDPTIKVHLIYATADNFVGRVLYHDLHKAYLLPDLAHKVAAAQAKLHETHPEWDIMVLDAARPLKVQYEMFHLVAGTPKNIYVANPLHGPGMHNYGAAVDATLVDGKGEWVDMGTPFDHFGPEAHINHEGQLLADSLITPEAYSNRRLLRRLMREQGLIPLPSEWWHFNLMSVSQARAKLKVVDI